MLEAQINQASTVPQTGCEEENALVFAELGVHEVAGLESEMLPESPI